jgi:chaperone BCS1
MTTNHIEKLDPALIRTGRVDRRFLIDYPDHDQIADMYKLHYEMEMPERVKNSLNGNKIPMSDIQGIFISERDLDKVAQLLGGQDAEAH